MNGTMRKHGKIIGYVVTSPQLSGVGVACHGLSDAKNTIMLSSSNTGTIFATRREAKRAINKALIEQPEISLYIHPVARLSRASRRKERDE